MAAIVAAALEDVKLADRPAAAVAALRVLHTLTVLCSTPLVRPPPSITFPSTLPLEMKWWVYLRAVQNKACALYCKQKTWLVDFSITRYLSLIHI